MMLLCYSDDYEEDSKVSTSRDTPLRAIAYKKSNILYFFKISARNLLFKFIIRSPFEPSSEEQKMDGHDRKNKLVKTSPRSLTPDHLYTKRKSISGEEKRVNPIQDKTQESHNYINHSSSSLKGHAAESKSPGVALNLSYDRQARDVSHSTRRDLVSNSGDAYDDYKRNDHLGSSSDEIIQNSNMKRRKLKCDNQMTGQGEGYHPSSRVRRHHAERRNPGVESSISHNCCYHRYDDRPSSAQARDASHGTGHDHYMSKSIDTYNEYKHDDHTGSNYHGYKSGDTYNESEHDDHTGSNSGDIIKNSNRKEKKVDCCDKTKGDDEDYHSNSRLLRHDPYVRNNNRYTDTYTNEGNLQSRRVQQDEFSMIRTSTATRRVERDDETYDICRMPNSFASRELSPPPQSNEIQNLMPGMFLLKKWLTENEQVAIIKKCQKLGLGRGGFFQPSFDSGRKMCLRMMCLGMNWNHKTHKYEAIRAHDNAQPPPIPMKFVRFVNRAIKDSCNELRKYHNVRTQEELIEALPGIDPDVCIVNFYEENGRLGVHQDKDESPESLAKGLPVVSFSIGDTAEFCFGKDRKFENLNKIMLESGDVLIFGGKSRLVFHGVSGLFPDTAPKWLTQNTKLRPGRLNLTFRQISV